MNEREKLKHNYFINVAKLTSKLSTCIRKQVGGVLIKNNRIICTGYNGTASGKEHCIDHFKNKEWNSNEHHEWSVANGEEHCEQNILLETLKNNINPESATLYITLSPCINCAKSLYGAGIKKIYYTEKYDRDQKGIEYLKNKGIIIEQV